jgi:hypothetical protein
VIEPNVREQVEVGGTGVWSGSAWARSKSAHDELTWLGEIGTPLVTGSLTRASPFHSETVIPNNSGAAEADCAESLKSAIA